jgi:hypothetical protein
MAASLLLVAVLSGSTPAPPPPPPPTLQICSPVVGDEAKTVAYLRGTYGVLALHAGQPLEGTLVLAGSEDSEFLTVSGEVAGSARQGSARYVRCGPDRVRQLQVTLGSGQLLYCVPHADYDNLNRVSCSRHLSDPNGDQELWFERFAP